MNRLTPGKLDDDDSCPESSDEGTPKDVGKKEATTIAGLIASNWYSDSDDSDGEADAAVETKIESHPLADQLHAKMSSDPVYKQQLIGDAKEKCEFCGELKSVVAALAPHQCSAAGKNENESIEMKNAANAQKDTFEAAMSSAMRLARQPLGTAAPAVQKPITPSFAAPEDGGDDTDYRAAVAALKSTAPAVKSTAAPAAADNKALSRFLATVKATAAAASSATTAFDSKRFEKACSTKQPFQQDIVVSGKKVQILGEFDNNKTEYSVKANSGDASETLFLFRVSGKDSAYLDHFESSSGTRSFVASTGLAQLVESLRTEFHKMTDPAKAN